MLFILCECCLVKFNRCSSWNSIITNSILNLFKNEIRCWEYWLDFLRVIKVMRLYHIDRWLINLSFNFWRSYNWRSNNRCWDVLWSHMKIFSIWSNCFFFKLLRNTVNFFFYIGIRSWSSRMKIVFICFILISCNWWLAFFVWISRLFLKKMRIFLWRDYFTFCWYSKNMLFR